MKYMNHLKMTYLKHHKMPRLKLISLAVLALAAGLYSCTSPEASEEVEKPNVVIIYTDDMNFDDIGALGGKVLTPTIDSLMNQGLYFSNYYACSAVCSPSRYNLLTGRYASRSTSLLGQYPTSEPAFLRWNTDIEPGERTMAHVMKEAGYFTGMVGKYHNLQNEDIQQHVSSQADLNDPAIQATVRANYEYFRDTVQLTSGFDYLECLYVNNLHALAMPESMRYHNMDWITQGALEFIEEAGDSPFLLYMPTTLPHDPAPIESMYADARITPSGLLEQAPGVQSPRSEVIERVVAAGFEEASAPYTWLDDAVGAVVGTLKEKGLLDNTILIFASDHGGNNAKMTCYEEGVRVPAFIYWKGHIKPGSAVPDLVANIDIAPTVYELCGVTPPEDEVIDGHSMLPLVHGEEVDWRTSLLLEITYCRAVISQGWKYMAVRFPERIAKEITPENNREFNQEGTRFSADRPGRKIRVRYDADRLYPGYYDRDQLYSLDSDPHEQLNLAGNPEHQAKMDELRAELESYLQDFPHSFGEFHQADDQ